jgi:hypothetical protein
VRAAAGAAVAWGRCAETDGAPAYWPWRQALRSLDLDADQILSGDDRFRLFEAAPGSPIVHRDRSSRSSPPA